MNSKDYLIWALTKDRNSYRRLSDQMEADHRKFALMHSVLGIAGEAGELTDAVKKHILYNQPLDEVNLKEECGDLLWYMALMLHHVGSSFEEVMKMNHDKLEKRYPSGFTEEHAKLRLDKKEG